MIFVEKSQKVECNDVRKKKKNTIKQQHCCPLVQMLKAEENFNFPMATQADMFMCFLEFSFCLFVFQ